MKFIVYLKITLKRYMSNWITSAALLILLPILLASVMGMFKDGINKNPLKLSKLEISVIDEDDSKMSTDLVEFLKSDDMNDLIQVVDKGKAEIKIPKGYEESIKDKKENKIILVDKGKGKSVLETLRLILDKYHKSLYLGSSGEKNQELSKILNEDSVETEIIDSKKEANNYELMAASMSGFVIMSLIYTMINANYTPDVENLERRTIVTPIKRQTIFIYEWITTFIYGALVLICYILFFKIFKTAFNGSILAILEIVIPASAFIATVSKFITTLFGKKYGQAVGLIIFLIPTLCMEMFSGQSNLLSKFMPTHYITKALNTLDTNGNLIGSEKDLIFILGASALLFLIIFIKESFSKGGERWA
ncbi:ABC transporter permease [Clostridium sp. SHJSY1]|uniref:ABC transporter permease n=1 Tax=Clostridium sp. SHJSY1 TaxID=2942483 RepID=UPI0028754E71|nr:ABC transporter permease [Clostridium sp. SHJSY1]MDS0526996.1 ABC transporter permease [Clostridium sp. SHJSY1]